MPSFRFLRCHHLRRPGDFQKVFQRRRSVSDDTLIIYTRESDLPYPRLGLSVSRKFGPAVHRNRLRRLIREAFRLTTSELPGGIDLVIIPRSGAEPKLEQLKDSLRRLVAQAARRLARDSKNNDSPAAKSDGRPG